MNKKDISIISRFSNCSEESIGTLLKEEVYPGLSAWKKFLNLTLLSLGIGLTVAGILFFFAYNWDDLHRLVKLGMAEGAVIATMAVVFFSNQKPIVKNIILTGASVLVGVMFALFGQIYNSHADAYTLFLLWSFAIVAWVVVSRFWPMWLLLVVLINTTVGLFEEQVFLSHYLYGLHSSIFFIINALFWILLKYVSKKQDFTVPVLVYYALAIGIASSSLYLFGAVLFQHSTTIANLMVPFVIASYVAAFLYARKERMVSYLVLVSVCVVAVLNMIILKIGGDILNMEMFTAFFMCMFNLAAMVFLILFHVRLYKTWKAESLNE